MSYVVDIVDGDPPARYEPAPKLCHGLAEARDARIGEEHGKHVEPPSARMRELHGRLTARYPCICDDEHGPWSDGPLIENFGQRIATLGVVYSRADEVIPFLISTSTGMGFWVFDPQAEIVHLPGGVVLRPAGAAKSWWQFWK
jgi:hypothetical protein